MKPVLVSLLGFILTTGISHAQGDGARLSLAEAIEAMEAHHPEIAARKARVDETSANSGSTPSLTPPMLSFGFMGENGPFSSNGRMENSYTISQTIPFPTKFGSESNTRKYENLEAQANLSAEALRLRAAVKVAYFELYGARKKVELFSEKQNVLEEHYKRVRAITLTDRIAQGHRISIQTEIELIKNSILRAKEEERIASGKLNVALGSDPFSKVPELENPPISPLPKPPYTVSPDHPEIRSLEASKNAAEASLGQSKSLWLPDFTLSYRKARRFDGVMPNYSEAMVGITLPFLYFWEPKNEVSAASARVRQQEAKIEKTRNDLRLQLLEAKAKAESLREQVTNYEERILPQGERRMKISHGLVPSDMESLNEHRSAMESVVDLKLAAIDLRVEYEKSVASLESLLVNEKEKP